MPGYGIAPAGAGNEEGSGLLPWAWAVTRLERSHDYWLATVRPDGRPHLMPVWGCWLEGGLWFSSGLRSRKARNLAHDQRCTATTDDALEPVVVDGTAGRVVDATGVEAFTAAVNAKYGTDYGTDFFDPEVNGCWRIEPSWVFALDEADFGGSPDPLRGVAAQPGAPAELSDGLAA